MKSISIISFLGVLALVSCSKDAGSLPGEGIPVQEGLTVSSYRILPPSESGNSISTKAQDLSGELSSLHAFLYDEDGVFLSRTEAPSSSISSGTVDIEYGQGARGTLLLLANISPGCAEALDGHSLSEISSGNVPIPLDENFNSESVLPMGGSAAFPPTEESPSVTLYRYFSGIKIGNVTVDLESEEDKALGVSFGRIVLTNSYNALIPVKGFGSEGVETGSEEFLFGKRVSLGENAFGGIAEGFIPGADAEGGSFTVQAGSISGSYPYLLNDNRYRSEGVLTVDCSGGLARMNTLYPTEGDSFERGIESTSVPYSPIVLGSELPKSVNVGKVLFALSGVSSDGSIPVYSGYSDQTRDPKIVLELLIGGEPRFYPIQLTRLQPGLMYEIPEITLKGSGGTFSNFMTRIVEYSLHINIVPWNSSSITSLDSGYGN